MLLEHELIIGISLSVVAFLMNTTEAIFLLRQKQRRTNYQNLILSLSMADILTSIFYIVTFLYKKCCKEKRVINVINQESLWFSITSSLFHVLAISFDRLLAIRFPIKHRCWYTGNKNKIVIILNWIFSFLLILSSIAVFFFTDRKLIVKMFISGITLATGVLLAGLYAYIIRKTVSAQCMIEIVTLKSGKREVISACSPKEKRILFTSIFIVASYILCSFPFAISYIIRSRADATIMLLIINCILNPVIYFFQQRYTNKRNEAKHRKTEKQNRLTSKAGKMEEDANQNKDEIATINNIN